jgi:hypothetical protein
VLYLLQCDICWWIFHVSLRRGEFWCCCMKFMEAKYCYCCSVQLYYNWFSARWICIYKSIKVFIRYIFISLHFFFFTEDFYFYLFIFFYCFVGQGYIVAFTKALTMCQIHHTWIHPSIALFYPSPPVPGTVSTGIVFTFTYMCTHYFHHIHPPTPLPPHTPSLAEPILPSYSLIL